MKPHIMADIPLIAFCKWCAGRYEIFDRKQYWSGRDGHSYGWSVLFPFNGVTTYSQTSLNISVYSSVYDQRKLILVREDSFSVKNLNFLFTEMNPKL